MPMASVIDNWLEIAEKTIVYRFGSCCEIGGVELYRCHTL